MNIVSFIFLIMAGLGTIYYVFSTLALDRHFRRVYPSPRPSLRPSSGCTPARGEEAVSVSLLKPVRGIDASMRANLLSFLDQDYPDYETLFGVLDEDDPAIDAVREVIKNKPQARLYIGSNIEGFNNKVRILHNLAEHSSGEIIIITDADTQATPDFINRITAPFAGPEVGMVTCMYRGTKGKTLADELEALHMSCIFAPGVATADALGGISFGLGAAIAIKRDVLDKFGGFESIRNYLADDFHLGRKTAQLGYDVVLSDYVIDITLSGEKFADVFMRELRWSVTTRVSRPWGHFGLFVTFGFAYALLCAISSAFSEPAWVTLAIAAGVRFISAYWGSICMGDREFIKRAWLLPARDILSFLIWAMGYFCRSVIWRGRKLTLSRDGMITGAK